MIIFHHIPKSAGTTISTALVEANQAPSLIIGAEGLSAHETSELSDLAFLSGHVTFPEIVPLVTNRETSHFSVLRHPLERLISYFEMVYRDNAFFRTEICFQEKWSLGFDIFLDRFVDVPKLNNLMCSYFHPSRRFYDAAQVITESFDFVGNMDNLGSLNTFLAEHLPKKGLAAPTTLARLNVSARGEPFWRSLRGTTLDRIRETNREDYLLFEWLKNRHDGAFVRPDAHTPSAVKMDMAKSADQSGTAVATA